MANKEAIFIAIEKLVVIDKEYTTRCLGSWIDRWEYSRRVKKYEGFRVDVKRKSTEDKVCREKVIMYGFKECSSCGALYNRGHCCSNVSSVDNFIRDPNPVSYDETPDSSKQPPRNCSKCGGPFGGLYCRQCTCERCRRNYTDEVCALCCYESFVSDSNLNSFIDSPNNFNPPSQPQTSSLDQWHCFHCKDPLERGECCKRCSCKWCGSGLSKRFYFICASNNKNSSIGDLNPNSFNDSQNLSDYPPQPQYQTNSCELCGNDAHYGYDCPPQVPFVNNQDPCFNKNFDNNFPQTSPSFP
ncbi:hypothetical protein Tco_0564693 [Tanacetum coccineum]